MDDEAIAREGLSMIDLPNPLRVRLSRRLVRAASVCGPDADSDRISLGALVTTLGDRSFGWCILVFTLINMLPLPPGTDMILSLPVLMLTAQMALGFDQVWLPGFVARIRVGRRSFQKLVMRVGPLMRRIEKVLRPRHEWLFAPPAERLLGAFLFLVSIALFAPIPFSGYLTATTLVIASIGLIERDGLVALAGAGLGLFAIFVTGAAGVMLFLGAEAALSG